MLKDWPFFFSSHTFQEPEVCHPCPVFLALSGHLKANLTRTTSTQSAPLQSHPTRPSHPSHPSTVNQVAPAPENSTPASIPLDHTWIWTYGTPLQTGAPTLSSPTIQATVGICEETVLLNIEEKKNVLLSLMGKNVNILLSFMFVVVVRFSILLYIFLDVLQVWPLKIKKKKFCIWLCVVNYFKV